jgi:preprotein translocase subunit SecD
MLKSITWRIAMIVLLTAAAIVVLVPSLTDKIPAAWKDNIPKINLGLDLQGGVFLRLQVEIDKAIENTAQRYADDARRCAARRGSRSSRSRRRESTAFP